MKKRILIVVKTYPNRSRKYQELVCTAGIDNDGNWYRIYPIPTKNLKEYEGLKKYTWIEAEIDKDKSDPRPESYKINISSVKLLESLDTKKNWQYRKDIVFQTKIYDDLQEIIKLAKDENLLSICLFKPKKFLKIYFEKKEIEEFTEQEKKKFTNSNRSLFDDKSCSVEFNAMPQIPYSIKMEFEDVNSKKSKMSILDWEISQLYLNLKNHGYNDKEIKQKIKDKLQKLMFENDLYLILGTMKTRHSWTSNPYTIIGLFYPPKEEGYTPSLFQI